jgi:nicotinamidase/pyrazinamidase
VQPYEERTALIVVDVQNDFADPRGSLYVAGGEEVVADANREAAAARAAGAGVFYTQDWHPEVTPHFAEHGGTWPVHCVAGTWGAEFHPDLVVDGPVVRKGTGGEDGYSGFSVRHPETLEERSTGLDDLLRGGGMERVVVLGLAGDVCVKATALDAARLGFVTTVLWVATRSVNLQPGDEDRARAELAAAGVTVEDEPPADV